MRNLIVLVVGLGLALATGCKDPKPEQPKTGSGSGSDTASKVLDAGPKQDVIQLPKLSGTPPVKTTKPIDKAKAEQLSTREFDGFKRDVRIANDNGIDVRYFTKERPRIMVSVNATKCFDCLPMELDKWQAKIDSLKVLMGPELKDLKDTVFEMGAVELGGATYVWSYHVGYNVTPEPGTGIAGAYATAYAIHYNDGVNMIRVVAEYKDDVPKSREDMLNLTPREDLEKIAKAFIDVFTHAWGD